MDSACKETKRMSELQKAAETKYCGGCELELPIDSFSVDNSRADGLNIRCRQCVRDRWREKNLTAQCGGCGRPSMNGTCWVCYQFDGLVFKLEEEIFLTVPRLIWHGRIARNRIEREAIALRKERRTLINEIAGRNLSRHERLRLLLEKVSNGA